MQYIEGTMVNITHDKYTIRMGNVIDFNGVIGTITVTEKTEELDTKEILKLIENAFKWEKLKDLYKLLGELNLLEVKENGE